MILFLLKEGGRGPFSNSLNNVPYGATELYIYISMAALECVLSFLLVPLPINP